MPHRLHRTISVSVVSLALALATLGCESKVTRDSFAQIKTGMTQHEVEKLLGGSGTEDSAPPGFEVTGGGVPSTKDAPADKIYVWKDGNFRIIVVFQGGKVVQKSTSGE